MAEDVPVSPDDQHAREDHEVGLAALRAAIIEGEESGPPTPFDFDEFIAEMHRKHRR